MSERTFPAGFQWGAATASYQIEGAAFEDGRGPSIWDTFARIPGAVLNGDTGDVACDHYHRLETDLDLMAELGLQTYRFSVAWPRIVPTGTGRVEPRGLDFYERLVDGLLTRGIVPVATLYHWDLPQPLEDAGGWPVRDTALAFEDYTAAVLGRLGDRVATWTTLNEPLCSAYLGYALGVHAPGRTDPAAALAAAHHLNLAHGLAARVIRELAPASQLSITINPTVVRPATDRPEDVDAARRIDAVSNRIFLDPLTGRGYPSDLLADTADVSDWAFVVDGDTDVIGQPLDVLGVNYYTTATVRARAGVPGEAVAEALEPTLPGATGVEYVDVPGPKTAMDWLIEPAGLTECLVQLHRDYGIPLAVTENGSAWHDEVTADDRVHDPDRVNYLKQHLHAVLDAVDAGADVRAYFAWSLMDNFEWAWGYSRRFGIVHVDYATQRRRIKDSGRWYADVIAGGGVLTD